MAFQHLGDRLLDDLFDSASFCHGQVSALPAGSGFVALHPG
jgi:hypothetical protein